MKTDFKPFDVVKIVGDNWGYWGGGIQNEDVGHIGFVTGEDKRQGGGAGDNVRVVATVSNMYWTMHPSQLVLVARLHNGKYRDTYGRFFSLNLTDKQKEAYEKAKRIIASNARADVVPKEVKKEAPKEKPAIVVDTMVLREKIKGADRGTCCSFVIQQGKEFHIHKYAPCHAQMRSPGPGVTAMAEGVACHVGKLKELGVDIVHYKRAVEWCINKGHFSDAFITKDVEEAFEHGIVCNVNTPGNKLFTSLVALRGFSEYYKKSETWCALVDRGVDPMVAWAVSDFTIYSKEKKDFTIEATSNAHRTFGITSTSRKQLVRFLKEGTWIRPGRPYSEWGSYDGAQAQTFGFDHNGELYNWAKTHKSVTKRRSGGLYGGDVFAIPEDEIVEFCKDLME